MTLPWFSTAVLLILKDVSPIRALLSKRIRGGGGGAIGVAVLPIEVILSAFVCADTMLIQCLHVFMSAGATRPEAATPRRRRHQLGRCVALSQAPHVLESCDCRDRVVSPPLPWWLSPALLGLFLAVLSGASGSDWGKI